MWYMYTKPVYCTDVHKTSLLYRRGMYRGQTLQMRGVYRGQTLQMKGMYREKTLQYKWEECTDIIHTKPVYYTGVY